MDDAAMDDVGLSLRLRGGMKICCRWGRGYRTCDKFCKVGKELAKEEGVADTFIRQRVNELRAAHEAEKVAARKARVEAARMAKKGGDVAEQPAKKAKMIEENAELTDVKLTQQNADQEEKDDGSESDDDEPLNARIVQNSKKWSPKRSWIVEVDEHLSHIRAASSDIVHN